MREIKFRAWDRKNSCWYKPALKAYRGELFELLISFGGDLTAHTMKGLVHQPDRFILMQYTGLSDKNGEEIYEGDVVEAVGYRISGGGILKSKMLVEWKDGGFRLKRLYKSPQTYPTLSDTKRLRVVGNIYENPKLLKGSE